MEALGTELSRDVCEIFFVVVAVQFRNKLRTSRYKYKCNKINTFYFYPECGFKDFIVVSRVGSHAPEQCLTKPFDVFGVVTAAGRMNLLGTMYSIDVKMLVACFSCSLKKQLH